MTKCSRCECSLCVWAHEAAVEYVLLRKKLEGFVESVLDVERVPSWAGEFTADPDDFEPCRFAIEASAASFAMAPDAFGFWIKAELAQLRRDLMDAYYSQRGVELPDRSAHEPHTRKPNVA